MGVNIHWSPTKVLSYDAYITMIIGDRGLGKTFSLTELIVRRFIKTGEQFMYIRRRATELDDVEKFFDDMIHHEKFPDHELKVIKDNKGGTFMIDGKIAGWARALSLQHYIKSVPFPDVQNILFDEFIVDTGGNKSYLPTEITDFLESMQSIGRLRKINCYMIANSISVGNPYFNYWNVTIQAGDGIKVVKRIDDKNHKYYGHPIIVVEWAEGAEYKKAAQNSFFGQLVKGTAYGDYAFGGEYLRDKTKFIGRHGKNTSSMATIRYDNSDFGVWLDEDTQLTYINENKIDSKAPVIVITFDEHEPTTLYAGRSHYVLKQLVAEYRNANLWFNSEVCFGKFKEVLRLIGA